MTHQSPLRGLAIDRKVNEAKAPFARAKKTELFYAAKLRQVAKAVGVLVTGFDLDDLEGNDDVQRALTEYARIIEPWARAVGWRMVTETAARDAQSWNRIAAQMGRAIRQEIENAPTGFVMRNLLAEQVGLITSLPRAAAQRVHDLTQEGIIQGTRPKDIAARIFETGRVTTSRAVLIARTEVARTASVLSQARAQHIGCTHFVWVTAGDSAVRASHRALNRQTFRYDDPPISDPPDHRSLPGQIWNCFPASTKVSLTNDCHYLWRHWYEGALVRVEHEAGFFEATPNHPILTRRGWIAAKDLKAGDHVIQSLKDCAAAFDDDKHEGQPTFGDLFASLDIGPDRESHVGLLFNFHGYRPRHNVDQIRTDLFLQRDDDPRRLKGVGNFEFAASNRGMIESSVGGPLNVGVARRSGGGADLGAVGDAQRLHPADVGLRLAAADDAVLFEDTGNRQATSSKTEFHGDGQLAQPAFVSGDNLAFGKVIASVRRRSANSIVGFDPTSAEALAQKIRIDAKFDADGGEGSPGAYKALRVVNQTFRDFSGHVFTMQTSNGWYSISTAGIVTKNCRCIGIPLLPD